MDKVKKPEKELEKPPEKENWSLYLLVNEKTPNTYLGVSTDPMRRLRQHNGEISGGAKATRSFGENWRIVLIVPSLTKSKALSIERTCKNLRHKAKGKTPLERRLYTIKSVVSSKLRFPEPFPTSANQC